MYPQTTILDDIHRDIYEQVHEWAMEHRGKYPDKVEIYVREDVIDKLFNSVDGAVSHPTLEMFNHGTVQGYPIFLTRWMNEEHKRPPMWRIVIR